MDHKIVLGICPHQGSIPYFNDKSWNPVFLLHYSMSNAGLSFHLIHTYTQSLIYTAMHLPLLAQQSSRLWSTIGIRCRVQLHTWGRTPQQAWNHATLTVAHWWQGLRRTSVNWSPAPPQAFLSVERPGMDVAWWIPTWRTPLPQLSEWALKKNVEERLCWPMVFVDACALRVLKL